LSKKMKNFLEELKVDDKEYGIINLAIKYSQMESFLASLKKLGIDVTVNEETRACMEFYSDKANKEQDH